MNIETYEPGHTRQATVVRWIDGDTVEVETKSSKTLVLQISKGVRVETVTTSYVTESVRIYGLNCPESRSTDLEEKKRGVAATLFAASLFPSGKLVNLKTIKDEKYERDLASLTSNTGIDFATEMIKAGHGVAYFGGKR